MCVPDGYQGEIRWSTSLVTGTTTWAQILGSDRNRVIVSLSTPDLDGANIWWIENQSSAARGWRLQSSGNMTQVGKWTWKDYGDLVQQPLFARAIAGTYEVGMLVGVVPSEVMREIANYHRERFRERS